MKDLGKANFIHGVKITQDHPRRSQAACLQKILERFMMHNLKPVDTSVEKHCVLSDNFLMLYVLAPIIA